MVTYTANCRQRITADRIQFRLSHIRVQDRAGSSHRLSGGMSVLALNLPCSLCPKKCHCFHFSQLNTRSLLWGFWTWTLNPSLWYGSMIWTVTFQHRNELLIEKRQSYNYRRSALNESTSGKVYCLSSRATSLLYNCALSSDLTWFAVLTDSKIVFLPALLCIHLLRWPGNSDRFTGSSLVRCQLNQRRQRLTLLPLCTSLSQWSVAVIIICSEI